MPDVLARARHSGRASGERLRLQRAHRRRRQALLRQRCAVLLSYVPISADDTRTSLCTVEAMPNVLSYLVRGFEAGLGLFSEIVLIAGVIEILTDESLGVGGGS